MSIRIAIVDEHEIVRESLKIFLETNDQFLFVGEASTPQETIALCARTEPDVLLFDFLSGYDCIDLLQTLRKLHKSMRVLVLTTNISAGMVVPAVEAGVFGYLFKQVDIDELSETIRAIHAGNQLFDAEVREILAAGRKRQGGGGLGGYVGLLALGLGMLPFIGHAHLSTNGT
jgi:DNA-binding NarL/FixJ family response regulator